MFFYNVFGKKRAKAHTIKHGNRIKTFPRHVQLVPEKYRSIFVGNKIAGKNTAIDGEIRRLPALIENTVMIGLLYPRNEVVGRCTGFTMSVRL
jgi:hypothetical protein